MYYIYGILNNINKKYYIGKTNNIKKRFLDHIRLSKKPKSNSYSYLHKAINKYGKENFEIFKLDSFDNENECYEFEIKYIKLLKSNDSSIGYNMNSGGIGGTPNIEVIKKISDKRKGFKFLPESIEKMKKSHIGQKSVLRKLSNDKVLEIKEIYDYCRAYKIKINYNVLYEQYSLKQGALLNIVNNITYREVKFNNLYTKKNINELERIEKLNLYDYKICSKCKESKLAKDFTPSNKLKCGFESHCRKCNSAYKAKKTNIVKISYNDIQQIYSYWDLGYSIDKIKNTLNMSNKKICNILNSKYKLCNRPSENINFKYLSGSKITKSTKQEIIEKYNSGKYLCEISKELNVTNSYIKYILKEKNITPTIKLIDDSIIYDIFKMYHLGVKKEELSKLFNIGRTSIYKIISGTY